MDNVIGKMNQQITILQDTGTTQDSAGAAIPNLVTIGPVFAFVDYQKAGSGESQEADQKTAFTSAHFTIRNSPERTITAKDTIVYRSQNFEIISVLEQGANRSFILMEAKNND